MKYINAYWRTILLLAIILTLSLMNMNKVVPGNVKFFKHFDKFVHFSMYFSLSFVFFIENYIYKNFFRRRWIVLDTITVGITIEFLQYLLTDYRTANFYDAVFNTLGVLAGSFCFMLLKKYSFIYKIMLFKSTSYKR